MMRFTLVILLILSGVLPAFSQQGNLVVFSGSNEPFSLRLNGMLINAQPGSHVKVKGAPPASYEVEVKFQNPSLPGIRQQLALKADRELTLSASKLVNGNYALIFVNEFSLVTSFAPVGEQLSFPFPPVVITDQVIQVDKPAPQPVAVTKPLPATEVKPAPVKESVVKKEEAIKPVAPGPVSEAVAVPVSVKPSALPGYTGPTGCENPMESKAFEAMKAKVQASKYSTTRMTVAKQLSDPECLLTTQVVEVMGLFTYDSDKVEFAKYAYGHTYDKGNYYKVKEAVVFAGSVDELSKFLEGK